MADYDNPKCLQRSRKWGACYYGNGTAPIKGMVKCYSSPRELSIVNEGDECWMVLKKRILENQIRERLKR